LRESGHKTSISITIIAHPYNPTILQKEKTTLDEKVVFSINQKNHETFTQLNTVVSNAPATCKPANESSPNALRQLKCSGIALSIYTSLSSIEQHSVHCGPFSISIHVRTLSNSRRILTMTALHLPSKCVAN
jgi:hypothetical protein